MRSLERLHHKCNSHVLSKFGALQLHTPIRVFYVKLQRSLRMSQEETSRSDSVPRITTAALFEKAVGDHSRRLLAIARAIVGNRASAEDVVQQALTNLFKHRDPHV